MQRVIQVERLDRSAVGHAVIATGLTLTKTTAAWLDHDAVPLDDAWVQRALVSALWTVHLRPSRAIVISVAWCPTMLSIAFGKLGSHPICRRRSDGKSAVWRLQPHDMVVANLGTVLDAMPRPSTTLAETCRVLAAAGHVAVVNPFELRCSGPDSAIP